MITVYTAVKVADGNAVEVAMHFDPEDPAAVEFTFENQDGTTAVWLFARDLLKEALEDGQSGFCDVLFQVIGDDIKMGLISPDGKGYVLFSQEIMSEFVELIYEEVPDGEDEYDVPEYVPEHWLV